MVRFNGIRQIYGKSADSIFSAHVLVVGLGGVGSWTVEALARSGIGALTLLDGDEVCVSNVNRQIHALDGSIGRPKAEVLAERVRAIHPDCRVSVLPEFFSASTLDRHLAAPYDYVVDAIDGVTNKTLLIAACRDRGLPLVVSGGAGARRDPTQVRVGDLSESYNDALLAFVRKRLRQQFGFPRKGKFRIRCVYSPELVPRPVSEACSAEGDGLFGASPRLNCEGGLGALAFVTGTFGFLAAAEAIRHITGRNVG